MSRKVLGLDIRQRSITAVLVGTTMQTAQVERVEYVECQPPIEQPGNDSETHEITAGSQDEPQPEPVDRGEMLLQMLDALSERIDFDEISCFVSFPPEDISYRNLVVPFKQPKKIKQVLPFELEPVMPGPVDELTFDFQLVNLPSSGDQTSVISASVKTGLLESYESCLEKGGVQPMAIVPGGLATADYLAKTCEDYCDYLFAGISEGQCTLFIIIENHVCCIRSFQITGTETGKIAGREILRTVLAFSEENNLDFQPETLFISGAGITSEFEAHLRVTSGIMVERADILKLSGMDIDNRLVNRWDSSLYDNALALAYAGTFGFKGIKLSERSFIVGKYFLDYKKQIINTGILLFLVIFVGLFNTIYDSHTINKKIKFYEKQMVDIYKETFPKAKKIIRPLAQLEAKVNEARKNAAFVDTSAGNIKVIDMLNDISKSLPDTLDIEFTRFVLGTENLKIAGDTDTYTTVNEMKTNFEKIKYFKKVDISSTTNDPAGKRVRFKLKIEF